MQYSSTDRTLDTTTRGALVVAHPGHELRVHAWLEIVRPRVFVLTDGSGHGVDGRIESTARVVDEAGASPGSIFGRYTDRDAYRMILDGDLETIVGLVLELADALVADAVETVASDAVEGFNPIHDLCFVIADEAARLASSRLGRTVTHCQFPLEAAPDARLGAPVDDAVRLDLDASALDRKLQAAWAYPEMRAEVERATANHGTQAFAVEWLFPAWSGDDLADLVDDPPSYERHGEDRVAAGIYDHVLRFREHFLPIVEGVRARTRAAEASVGAA